MVIFSSHENVTLTHLFSVIKDLNAGDVGNVHTALCNIKAYSTLPPINPQTTNTDLGLYACHGVNMLLSYFRREWGMCVSNTEKNSGFL